ncbi:MAG TPA: hypothetical protein VNT22_02180 [Baekduia sp.]|nr:hypothetical protein [Baekduia sp.]
MHTARQLEESQFDITIDGRPATRADLFPDWNAFDRLGVVIHEPFGTIGASYLLQLAITAFYDERPKRRDRSNPIYPDVFVFHVGGRFGDHANFDVFPPRKEVFVDNNPMEILNAINDRGITRLAVPDRVPDNAQFDFKEPEQAADRISTAWAYSTSGRTAGADVAISSSLLSTEANGRMTLHPKQSYHDMQEALRLIGKVVVPDDEVFRMPKPRDAEVDEETRDRIRDERLALKSDKTITETYRRIEVKDALRMLHHGAAPDFIEVDMEALMQSDPFAPEAPAQS